MTDDQQGLVDPCNYGLRIPYLQPHQQPAPKMPDAWYGQALLHPFGPPPEGVGPDSPFYQLCTANLAYSKDHFFSVQITGREYAGRWWYIVDGSGTYLSTDGGGKFTQVNMGWEMPGSGSWFGGMEGQQRCAGTSYLNWMAAQQVDWWKSPVKGSKASRWIWFDSDSGAPVRMMFGAPPPQPEMGDPGQLAVFQMFSFTYVPSFMPVSQAQMPTEWLPEGFDGFAFGNPGDLQLVRWKENFGTSTFMTPVDEASNPLPTRFLYLWAEAAAYRGLTDRAQSTLMDYRYNPANKLVSSTALMFGPAPQGVQPPKHSGSAIGVNLGTDGSVTCGPITADGMPLGEEPPWWASIPQEQGTIHANIANNPVLCPGQRIAVISELFPVAPSYPQYPLGRYLWTWYSPIGGSDGSYARPVTFMESASQLGVGTSLALADYFDYEEFPPGTIQPACFTIPPACA